ncbi:MAG: survival protein SurE [Actinobacteria bacterium]|nr:survival protein SurE [Actinomycetota bacterium]
MVPPHRSLLAAGLLLLLLTGAACASSTPAPGTTAATGANPAATAEPATTRLPPLRVLVTNDDGYASPGIDALVEALRAEPNVEVAVVAPLKNQSGAAGQTTNGPVAVTDVATNSGYPAKAVDGFPADSVNWALDGGIGFSPDLVVSGNNAGQNIGMVVEVSGTVGAARAGAKRGIPAVALSQGLANPIDYPSGTKVFIDWFRAKRSSLPPASSVVSFNTPSCTAGSVRGVLEVPTATAPTGAEIAAQDCTSTVTAPADDVAAFTNGYATQSTVGLSKQ